MPNSGVDKIDNLEEERYRLGIGLLKDYATEKLLISTSAGYLDIMESWEMKNQALLQKKRYQRISQIVQYLPLT